MLDWRWEFAFEILPQLIWPTINTLLAAGIGYAIALIVGLMFALAQRTHFRSINWVVREAVEFIRSTPLVLQIFFVFYIGPQFGFRLSPWTAGMIAIGLHYAAFLSEVYRGALESIPLGQWRACQALSLGMRRTYFRIIIPQALPSALPGMGIYLVGIFKDIPMLSVIGVAELLHAANSLGAESYRFLEPYTMVGVIILALSLFATGWLRVFEAWVRRTLHINPAGK